MLTSLLIGVVSLAFHKPPPLTSVHQPASDNCMVPAPKPSPEAPPPQRPQRVVVVDASPSKEAAANANRIFVLDACSDSSLIQNLWALLARQFDNGQPNPASAAKLRTFLLGNARQLAKFSSNRWVSRKGDQVDVYVLHVKGVAKTIDFTESPRKTRLESDLTSLTQLAAAIAGAATKGEAVAQYETSVRSWTLEKELANLKISVSDSPAPPSPKKPGPPGNNALSVAGVVPADAEDTGPSALATTIITGPKEHFFLSANAGETDVRQITYNPTTKTLAPAKKPTTFYVSANYSLGDLYDEGNQVSWANRFIGGIYLGIFLEASAHPFQQFGGIVGFRRNLIPPLDELLPLQTVSPFLGWIWVRNDKVGGAAADPTVSSEYAKPRFLWGLSLNLDKALGWIGS